jgi:hypothetical protein
MKKLLAFLVFITFQNLIPIKESQANLLNQSPNKAKSDTLKNDLVLIKPLINFNEPNGGYYSDYIDVELNSIFCGAVVQNCGVSSTTDFYLEFSLLTYDNQVIDSYQVAYKDTLPPGKTDTLNFQEAINFDYWDPWNFRFLAFTIKNHLNDSNLVNKTDTIPYKLWHPDWTEICRANIPTDTIDISEIESFKSGDFIGITAKLANSGHQTGYFFIESSENWPKTVSKKGIVYMNGKKIATIIHDGWAFSLPSYVSYFYPDSLYYIGIELAYSEGTSIPIVVDTSSFHNFEAETIARIGDKWTTLPFVPLITLKLDPEGINSKQTKNQIPVYPNPTKGIISIDNVLNATIELYDLSGKLLFKETHFNSNKSMDISKLSNGNYLVKFITDDGVVTKIVTILK